MKGVERRIYLYYILETVLPSLGAQSNTYIKTYVMDLGIQNCSNTLAGVIVVQCVNTIPGRLGSQSKLQLLFIIVPVMPYHAEW